MEIYYTRIKSDIKVLDIPLLETTKLGESQERWLLFLLPIYYRKSCNKTNYVNILALSILLSVLKYNVASIDIFCAVLP